MYVCMRDNFDANGTTTTDYITYYVRLRLLPNADPYWYLQSRYLSRPYSFLRSPQD
jgi:hypothetical protein